MNPYSLERRTQMNTTEPTVVIHNYPTIKEQLAQGGISLAIGVGVTVAYVGVFALVDFVGKKVKARKAAQTETTPSTD
jgi:hypothetical protein